MAQYQPLSRRSLTTWGARLLALALSAFYVDAMVQYGLAAAELDPQRPQEARIVARNLFEDFSLTATKGASIVWAKVIQSLLGVIGIASSGAAALLMWRAPDNQAGHQVAGLAMAYLRSRESQRRRQVASVCAPTRTPEVQV